MKILHVISDLSMKAGGPPVSVISNASILNHLGNDCIVATTNKYGRVIDIESRSHVPVLVHTFACLPPEKFAFSPGLVRFLWKEIPRRDMVIIHGLYLFHTLAAAIICRYFDIPYVIQPHGSLDPYIYRRHRFRKAIFEYLFQNNIFRHAASFWFASQEEAELAEPVILGAPWFVSAYVIDLKEFTANIGLIPFAEAFKRARILFYGRVNFKKGLDLLIEAYGLLLKRGVICELVVVGPTDNEMRPRLKKWEHKFGVVGKVKYIGNVAGKERVEILSGATVFALPSYSENFGIAVLEAIAIGLPVVISDQVNIHHEISAGKVGWVTKCDANEVANALQVALTNEVTNMEYRENCREFVKERFDVDKVGKDLEMHLKSLIARTHAK